MRKLKSIILIFIALIISNCQSNEKQDLLAEKNVKSSVKLVIKEVDKNKLIFSILKDSLKITKDYSKIFYLAEIGCISCNKSFSNLIQKNINDENLYILNASGNRLDISYYLESKKENIVFDYDNYLFKNKIVEGSSAIWLKNNKIDTIVKISAQEIESQFEYIEKN